jgi:hypothetical protein
MITGDIRNTRDYFENLAAVLDVDFVYGSSKKLVAKSRSSKKYPIMHLNRPMVRTSDNGMANRLSVFYLEVTFMDKYVTTGLEAEQDVSEFEAEERCLNYLYDVLKQLNHDNSDGVLSFDFKSVTIDPVMDKWIDKHSGWKMSFKMMGSINSKVC